jgi:hypothetical protein
MVQGIRLERSMEMLIRLWYLSHNIRIVNDAQIDDIIPDQGHRSVGRHDMVL